MNRLNFLAAFKREKPAFRYSSMRYLYKILRLFYCPHRWTRVGVDTMVRTKSPKDIVAEVRTFRCRHCGKEYTEKIRFDN